MNHRGRRKRFYLFLIAVAALVALGAAGQPQPTRAGGTPTDIYALTGNNVLLRFRSDAPGTLTGSHPITGLAANEQLLGIDFRPLDGRLYALGNSDRLYTINPATGAASLVSLVPFGALTGTSFGFDFNPLADRLRVVSDDEENLRLHPDTGVLVMPDTALAYAPQDPSFGVNPTIGAAAYTDNVGGTTVTTLYVIDYTLDILARQGGPGGTPSPNTGQLYTIGSLGINVSDYVGFDISPAGEAYAAIIPLGGTQSVRGGSAELATVNLATGQLTSLGLIGGGYYISGIAIPTVDPEPLPQETLYALTSNNRLLRFNSATPSTLSVAQPITGVGTGETLLALDSRPADGRLYALSSANKVYTLDPMTGVAAEVSGQPFTPALTGVGYGFDFNPVVDRIRAVSDAEQNLRLHPDTGAVVQADTPLVYEASDPNFGADPNIVAAAYFPVVSGTTTLYGMDAGLGVLVRQGGPDGTPSPNGGQLFTVGALGVAVTQLTAFDISPRGTAFTAFTDPGGLTSNLALVNLATGRVTRIGPIGGEETIIGLTSPAVAAAPPEETIFALTGDGRLLRFSSRNPSVLLSTRTLQGRPDDEMLVGLDFRPATGHLYALGTGNRLYRINPQTGEVRPVGAQPFTPPLEGSAFGFDFNPVVDRIRTVSDAEQSLRLHPDTGAAVQADTPLAYATGDLNQGGDPSIVAAAYSNNVMGSTATTLYVIDASRDTLALQGGAGGTPSPNTGDLSTIGALGVDVFSAASLDISPTGNAYAALIAPGDLSTQLYSVELGTGRLTLIGTIGTQESIVGMAIPTASFRYLQLLPLLLR